MISLEKLSNPSSITNLYNNDEITQYITAVMKRADKVGELYMLVPSNV
jgi:hypothetical protein